MKSFGVKVIKILIVILVISLLTYRPKFCFSENSLNLSGKYKGYNVILIILDALRPDHLSCYSYYKETSSHIDELAQHGIIFKNAFSQASYTLPSVVSIFTSLYPFSHGVNYIYKDKVPERLYTLAQILNIYGYNTVWFGDIRDPHSGGCKGVLRGFTDKYNVAYKYEPIFNWMTKHTEEPFFITVHSYSTHERTFIFNRFNNKFYNSIPKDVISLLDATIEKSWNNFQNDLRNRPDSFYKLLGKDWVEKHKDNLLQPRSRINWSEINDSIENEQQVMAIEKFRRRYFDPIFKAHLFNFLPFLDSSIFESDNILIGGLINYLKKLNLYNKTIIIISADHGNEYMEHGDIGHGGFLYDESIHIPLITYLPNLIKPISVDELVQSIDMLPTVLDLLAIPIPYQTQGISLVGLMEEKDNALINKYIFSRAADGSLSIRSKYWKFIQKPNQKPNKDLIDSIPWLKSWLENIRNKDKARNNITGELYDLQKDKYEKNNLIKIKPEIAEYLKRCLDSKLNSLVQYQKGDSEFMPGLDEETKERIKKTGYW